MVTEMPAAWAHSGIHKGQSARLQASVLTVAAPHRVDTLLQERAPSQRLDSGPLGHATGLQPPGRPPQGLSGQGLRGPGAPGRGPARRAAGSAGRAGAMSLRGKLSAKFRRRSESPQGLPAGRSAAPTGPAARPDSPRAGGGAAVSGQRRASGSVAPAAGGSGPRPPALTARPPRSPQYRSQRSCDAIPGRWARSPSLAGPATRWARAAEAPQAADPRQVRASCPRPTAARSRPAPRPLVKPRPAPTRSRHAPRPIATPPGALATPRAPSPRPLPDCVSSSAGAVVHHRGFCEVASSKPVGPAASDLQSGIPGAFLLQGPNGAAKEL